jgi:hypothetical protein
MRVAWQVIRIYWISDPDFFTGLLLKICFLITYPSTSCFFFPNSLGLESIILLLNTLLYKFSFDGICHLWRSPDCAVTALICFQRILCSILDWILQELIFNYLRSIFLFSFIWLVLIFCGTEFLGIWKLILLIYGNLILDSYRSNGFLHTMWKKVFLYNYFLIQ